MNQPSRFKVRVTHIDSGDFREYEIKNVMTVDQAVHVLAHRLSKRSEYNYPKEETLQTISSWSLDDPHGWMDFVCEYWWSPDFGFSKENEEEKQCVRYNLSTGGWSGNEELISAMKSHQTFWMMYWVSSRRGGHHVFRIPTQ